MVPNGISRAENFTLRVGGKLLEPNFNCAEFDRPARVARYQQNLTLVTGIVAAGSPARAPESPRRESAAR